MNSLRALRADLRRFPWWAPVLHPSCWSVAVFRIQQAALELADVCRVPRAVILPALRIVSVFMQVLTGNEIPPTVEIGPGLMIWHSGGIVIHSAAKIGEYCTLHQGVTIGIRYGGGETPVIGDRANFGAYAQVLGGLTIGDDCTIGAMAVVLSDIPAGATAVGIPAVPTTKNADSLPKSRSASPPDRDLSAEASRVLEVDS
jgi:serine O-acetyltransferase